MECIGPSHALFHATRRDIGLSRKLSLLVRHGPQMTSTGLPFYRKLDGYVLELISINIAHQGFFTAVIFRRFICGLGVSSIHPYFIAKCCPHNCISPLVFPASYWLTGLFPGLPIINKAAMIIIKNISMNIVIHLLMSKYSESWLAEWFSKETIIPFPSVAVLCPDFLYFGCVKSCKQFF